MTVQHPLPTHHPGEELLVAYAAGAAAEPLGLLVASHLALCPQCRADVERLESVGGALLSSIEPASVDRRLLEATLDRLDDPEPATRRLEEETICDAETRSIPQPLRSYLGAGLASLAWKRRGAVSEAGLLVDRTGHTDDPFNTRLLRIPAGRGTPRHTHRGREFTLVLTGAFHDGFGHYLRGDVAAADPSIEHRPVADPGEDCLCLAVTDAPLTLTGPVGRLLNPFIKT